MMLSMFLRAQKVLVSAIITITGLFGCTGTIEPMDGGPDGADENQDSGQEQHGSDESATPMEERGGSDENTTLADETTGPGDDLGIAEPVRSFTDTISIGGAPNNPYQRVVIENDRILVSFLPRLGGRIYEFIFKDTSHNELYKNSIWRETNWGVNPCRSDGKWKAIGGSEFAIPENEHGCIYDQEFQYQVASGPSESKIIRLWKDPDQGSTYGLKLTLEVTVKPNNESIEIRSLIENPSSNPDPKPFQYWINAMVTPGDLDPRNAQLEFVYPASITQQIVHSSCIPELTSQCQNPNCDNDKLPFGWPTGYGITFSLYDQWKDKGWLGAFAESPNYHALYSHVAKEGFVRVTKQSMRGLKLFALGTIPTDAYTDNGRQYIELWSGWTKDFWTYDSLAAGSTLTLVEYWFPVAFVSDPADLRGEIENAISRLVP